MRHGQGQHCSEIIEDASVIECVEKTTGSRSHGYGVVGDDCFLLCKGLVDWKPFGDDG